MNKPPVESEGITSGEKEAYAEVAPEEEEDTTGMTLEEYMASKKKATFRKEARKPEENKKTNIETVKSEKHRTETIQS